MDRERKQSKEMNSLAKKKNQYDKAEELITFYTFAPLGLREGKKEVVEQILRLASVYERVKEPVDLSFERQFKPPKGYLKWLAQEAKKHPVRYVREQGKEHADRGKRLEGNTHVDVIIETENLLILVEVKFTSDIDCQRTYNVNRNQLARTIDVGISEANRRKNKRLVVLLCSLQSFITRGVGFTTTKFKSMVIPKSSELP